MLNSGDIHKIHATVFLKNLCVNCELWKQELCLEYSKDRFSLLKKGKAMDLAFITSHIYNWLVFLLWLYLFILSGIVSPLISSSILGTYQPGEFIFQCPIFLPVYTVHGALKARTLKWFAISSSSGPHFVRTLHHDLSILGSPTWYGS